MKGIIGISIIVFGVCFCGYQFRLAYAEIEKIKAIKDIETRKSEALINANAMKEIMRPCEKRRRGR